MNGRAFDGIQKGDKTTAARVITGRDIETFAELTGDFNPIHLDTEFAQLTIFGTTIAHGILIAGLISAAVSRFPGVIVYLSQSLDFLKPVRVGDRVEAVAEVIEKEAQGRELRLSTTCVNQLGEVVINGEARVKVLEILDARKTNA